MPLKSLDQIKEGDVVEIVAKKSQPEVLSKRKLLDVEPRSIGSLI